MNELLANPMPASTFTSAMKPPSTDGKGRSGLSGGGERRDSRVDTGEEQTHAATVKAGV